MRTLALSLTAALAVAGCSSKPASHQLSASDARDTLINRNWMDRMPQTHSERLHVYRFVPTMGGGVYQDRTLFKGTFELFLFKVDGDQIVFQLPETHERVASQYSIDRVDGPAPFDLKLTIFNDPRGPHEYYGTRTETDRDGSALEAKLAAKRGELE
ncbi:MAG TPA: hypothetical protein VGC42_31185 [Kofleriaceae bacterium]